MKVLKSEKLLGDNINPVSGLVRPREAFRVLRQSESSQLECNEDVITIGAMSVGQFYFGKSGREN